jgi:hypothetical protein
MRSHIHQREAGSASLRFDRNDVLIFRGAHFQFDVPAAGAFASELMGTPILSLDVGVYVQMAGVANHDVAVLFKLAFVVVDDFLRSVIRLVFECDDS